MLIRRIHSNPNILKPKNNIILKRYFFNTIEKTKVTKRDILIFQNSMNSLFIFCSFLWAIETNHKLNELNFLYRELFYKSFILCQKKTNRSSLCNEIFESNNLK